ncbi:MAG: M13-type metalloendopeptidase [Steroidobacteraceae bacterium]
MKTSHLLPLCCLLGACATLPTATSRSGLDLPGFDLGVRPQDDLYRFTAGGWERRTEIPADQSNYGAFSKLDDQAQVDVHELLEELGKSAANPGSEERKLADLYRSFMDTQRVEQADLAPLSAELARIAQIATPTDLARYIGYNQGLGIAAPLQWYVQQDARNATVYISYVDQSGLSLPDRDYYLRSEQKYQDYRQKLHDYARQLLTLGGDADAASEADRILAIESQLARAQWSNVQNRNPVATYNRKTLAQAAELAPGIDWRTLFEAIGISAQDEFVVSQPSFFTTLGVMLQTVPVADWRAYFRYRLLDESAPYLPERFVALHFDFHQRTLSGVQQMRPRWKRGVALANGAMGQAVGKLYVARHFSAESRQRARQLVANLMATYRQSIDSLEWMGPETRAQAQQKLAAFTVKIGYPDKWRDYSALQIDAEDLAGNVLRANQFDHQRLLRRLGAPVDRSEWLMTPQTVNAYYNPLMNEIVFPAAILQPPFYNAQSDDAVNYGAIGAVIGHEISHGFDDQGSQFDAQGNLRNWWTEEDAARFKQRTSALVQQYSSYTVLDGEHVNGELTLGENIADLSGLAIAYKAYLLSLNGRPAPLIDGYSGAQRFFFGWGQVWRRKYRDDNLRQRLAVDPHSPSEFRANGPASNIDAFYAAFNVQPGDKLYRPPAERVKIW